MGHLFIQVSGTHAGAHCQIVAFAYKFTTPKSSDPRAQASGGRTSESSSTAADHGH